MGKTISGAVVAAVVALSFPTAGMAGDVTLVMKGTISVVRVFIVPDDDPEPFNQADLPFALGDQFKMVWNFDSTVTGVPGHEGLTPRTEAEDYRNG